MWNYLRTAIFWVVRLPILSFSLLIAFQFLSLTLLCICLCLLEFLQVNLHPLLYQLAFYLDLAFACHKLRIESSKLLLFLWISKVCHLLSWFNLDYFQKWLLLFTYLGSSLNECISCLRKYYYFQEFIVTKQISTDKFSSSLRKLICSHCTSGHSQIWVYLFFLNLQVILVFL